MRSSPWQARFRGSAIHSTISSNKQSYVVRHRKLVQDTKIELTVTNTIISKNKLERNNQIEQTVINTIISKHKLEVDTKVDTKKLLLFTPKQQ